MGYDDEAIVDDFLTTNLHNYEEVLAYKASGVESLTPTVGAHSEHLMAAFKAVDRQYGSFENYLTKGLKLTPNEIAAIRANLLVVKE
ncbi:MAG: tyrosine-protein phosphatase [Bacteroidota bacterium]